MNRAKKRRNKKLSDKATKASTPMQAPSPAPATQQQTLAIQQAIDLGLQHHNAGDLPKAEGIYQQILQAEPKQPFALHFLGVINHQKGKSNIAADLIGQALAIKPDYAEAHNNLGLVFLKLERLDDAIASYRKALAIKPKFFGAHCNLGLAFRALGKLGEAVASYRAGLAIEPNNPEAYNDLGEVLKELGNLTEAITNYQKAITIKPDFAEAYNNLGNALNGQGKPDEALAKYRKAITINPDLAEAHSNLGIALNNLGRQDDAVASYQKALSIKPDQVQAHNNLGNTLKELGQLDEAVANYQKALSIKPDSAETHFNLGSALEDQGDGAGSAAHFDQALSFKPEMDGWRVRKALFLPPIPSSSETISLYRKTFGETVASLRSRNLAVENPVDDVGVSSFYLSYHNLDNKPLLEALAELYIAACPKLTYEAEHCRSDRRGQKDRLRIGFLSNFFHNHTVGRLTTGIIEHLSRKYFQVIVFRPPGRTDKISKAIDRAADKVIPLSRNLDRDREIIAQQKLDILFYPDIGLVPYTYFLSFARLAPVQVTSWGHGDTTGVPNIDYFISSSLIEPPGASSQYSEQLVQLSVLPSYCIRPEVPEKSYSRKDFDLEEGGSLYICPQTLFKFHPDFDNIIGDLLHRDPKGHLALVDDGKGGCWNTLLTERISRKYPDIVNRIIFVPKMPYKKFHGFLTIADVILDTPTFTGGLTSLQAFAMAVPVVTSTTDFMRGRVTSGYYKQMGLKSLITSDANTYVSLALKLAHDIDFRHRMQAEIRDNSYKLYERVEVIRELEAFFIAATMASYDGQKLLKDWQPNNQSSNQGP